ncbi:PKD domain-containing protein, partial [Haloferula helveola]
MKTNPTYPLVAFAALGLSAPVWSQTSVPITNAGFEDPVLADSNSASPVPGWTDIANGATVFNPSATQFSSGAAEGDNVASVFEGSAGDGLSQVLAGATGLFQADASYTLTVEVGDPADADFDGYTVQLLANGTLLAEDDNTQAPVDDGFVTSTVNYVYNAGLHSGLVGEALEIRLLSKALGAGTSDVNFDDVQLSVTLAEPIADTGGPYAVEIPGGSLSLDGSNSLPSDGQTITTYDWDVDNDTVFDITGVTPASIDYATLTGVYGMVEGENTIQLRVTDSLGKTSTTAGSVTLFEPVLTYTGPNSTGGQNTWNTAGNWDGTQVPNGSFNVLIPSGAYVVAWDDATPAYTGDLTMESNSTLQIGWTTNRPNSYNALGTPGQTTITMGDGALVKGRTQTNVTVPEVELLGDATFSAGESTQTPANFTFANPITGA